MTPLSPQDTSIAHRYTSKTLDVKVRNKTALQEELNWPAEPRRPMICLPAGMSDELGGTLFKEVLPGLLSQPLEIIVLGKGGSAYGSLFTDLAKKHGHRIGILRSDPENVRRMLAASDMALYVADPGKPSDVAQVLRFGVVPVSLRSPALENYDPVQERGNSFLYEESRAWHCFAL